MLQQLIISPEIAIKPQLVVHLSVMTTTKCFQLQAYTTHCARNRKPKAKDKQSFPKTMSFHHVHRAGGDGWGHSRASVIGTLTLFKKALPFDLFTS